MEKFFSLPIDKQHGIIDAALSCFGTNGYKKTSISDIAAEAGISKAMVFHYFGTKKALYLYLIEYCSDLVIHAMEAGDAKTTTDFFERIKQATDLKIALMEKHTAVLFFLTGVYFETNEEVAEDIAALFAKSEVFRNQFVFSGLDLTKFKDGVDAHLLLKMLTWMAEGYTNQLSNHAEFDIRVIGNEFYRSFDLLRTHLYKPEYL
ncbi:TetR/AcrR family transcriptional regulator [Paenibacillus macerans]|uniref:TetR/AcrR family transcriptional regulator n=1 Tax=Paenibacillus macerans TaxID=44252 RepID=UPI003D323AC6